MPRWALLKGIGIVAASFSASAALLLALLAFMGSRVLNDMDTLTQSVNKLVLTVSELNGTMTTRLAETNGRIAVLDGRVIDMARRQEETTVRVGRLEDYRLKQVER